MNTERIDEGRRAALKTGGGATLLALLGGGRLAAPGAGAAQAQAWNKAAFDTHNVAETMQALGGGDPAQSKDIVFFQTPDIAENGAVVPVGITSNIPKTESIAILIEKNPEHAGRGVRHSRGHRAFGDDTREDGTEFEHLRAGQGRWQVLRCREGRQGHAGRMRRMTWQTR